MISMKRLEGNIVIQSGANVWPHELRTAEAFAIRGHDVVFPKKSNDDYRNSPDTNIFGLVWEIKSPRSPKPDKVLKIVREAIHQSPNVIYDSQRIKNLTDIQIEHELRKISPALKALKNLLFVNRKRNIIVVKQTDRFDI